VPDFDRLVKACGIGGTVPDEMNALVAQDVGAVFARLTGARHLAVARDMRGSSPALAAALAGGVAAAGADVLDAGPGSADYACYASGALGIPAAMITAGHGPAAFNGIRLWRAGAEPVGEDTGLARIRAWLKAGDIPAPAATPGTVTSQDLRAGYVRHLRSLVPLERIRPLKVVADAGNGTAAHMIPFALAGLPVELVPVHFDLDGTFPGREARPLKPGNLLHCQARVLAAGADIGLAFDADGGRCLFTDEQGQPVPPSAITALLAARELARHPGSAIVHDVITSAAATEIIREHGGTPVRSRGGHSCMNALMASRDAPFGGEHSGRYYFRDFWRASTGILAALHVLAALGTQDRPLSELTAEYTRYTASGETSSRANDAPAKLNQVETAYARPGVTTDRLDGLTVNLGDGRWFNLRPSDTGPLLRLNVEAPTHHTMTTIRDEVLDLIR
jgi:phosphomannomutase